MSGTAALPSCLMVDGWHQCQEDTVSVLSGDLFAMAKKTADQAEPTWRFLLLLLLLLLLWWWWWWWWWSSSSSSSSSSFVLLFVLPLVCDSLQLLNLTHLQHGHATICLRSWMSVRYAWYHCHNRKRHLQGGKADSHRQYENWVFPPFE